MLQSLGVAADSWIRGCFAKSPTLDDRADADIECPSGLLLYFHGALNHGRQIRGRHHLKASGLLVESRHLGIIAPRGKNGVQPSEFGGDLSGQRRRDSKWMGVHHAN